MILDARRLLAKLFLRDLKVERRLVRIEHGTADRTLNEFVAEKSVVPHLD
jgi:hypothetical protein